MAARDLGISVMSQLAMSEELRALEEAAGPFTVLVVGAHPDDIELGATALVHRLAGDERVDLWLLVLTDDDDGPVRRREAIEGARLLGVDESRLLFAGFPDGRLQCSRDSVGAVRSLLQMHGIEPDVAVTHTRADSHNDHRNAAEIMQSALRGALLLQYGVAGSLEHSHFHPTIFVDASSTQELRHQALSAHVSQTERLPRFDSSDLLAGYGHRLGVELAEGYTVIVQRGARRARAFLDLIDDRPFERLWRHLAPRRTVGLVYGLQTPERRAYSPFDADHERRATSALVRRLRLDGAGAVEVLEHSPLEEAAVDALHEGTVVLVGGPVSNRVVRDYFNRFVEVDRRVEYDMPGFSSRRVSHRHGPDDHTEIAGGRLVVDVGLLTVLPNPCCPGALVIAAMGAFGPATARAVDLLIDPPDDVLAGVVAAVDQGLSWEHLVRVEMDHDEAAPPGTGFALGDR